MEKIVMAHGSGGKTGQKNEKQKFFHRNLLTNAFWRGILFHG